MGSLSQRSSFLRHEQLVHAHAKRVRQALKIVQGNISGLTFNVRNEGPMQARLECKGFL